VRNQCHCTGCHRTFHTVSGFEAHWVGRGDDRHCIDSATVGLVEKDRLWATPEGHALALVRVTQIAERRASGRAQNGNER